MPLNGFHLLHRHIKPLARRHPAAVGVPPHQSAGKVAVGDEEEAGREFVPFGGGDGHFDLAPFAATRTLSPVFSPSRVKS